MKRFINICALIAIALLCCQCGTSAQLRRAQKGAKPISHQVLDNYYVRNTVDCSKVQRLIFDNQQDFDAVFGPAALMGSRPTAINWNTQYVAAIVLPETNRPTMVTPISVKGNENAVIINYQVIKGRKSDYTIVPFTAIALDKLAQPRRIEVYFVEK